MSHENLPRIGLLQYILFCKTVASNLTYLVDLKSSKDFFLISWFLIFWWWSDFSMDKILFKYFFAVHTAIKITEQYLTLWVARIPALAWLTHVLTPWTCSKQQFPNYTRISTALSGHLFLYFADTWIQDTYLLLSETLQLPIVLVKIQK